MKLETLSDVMLLTECPHCGDKESGFSYIYTARHKQYMGWTYDSKYTDYEEPETIRRGAVKCDSCGKKLLSAN